MYFPKFLNIFDIGPSGLQLRVSSSKLGHLGPSWGHLGALLGPPGAILGPSWALLGPPWGPVGPSWGHPGAILASLDAILGHLVATLGQLVPLVSRPRPSRSHLGAFFEPSWGHFRCMEPFRRPPSHYMRLCWTSLRALFAACKYTLIF